MYDYFNPAVVRAIKQVIEAGHKEGIKVGMCGEMAGDQKAVELLLDLGLDEFSMSLEVSISLERRYLTESK